MAGTPTHPINTTPPKATAKRGHSAYQDLNDASLNDYAAPAVFNPFDNSGSPFCSLMQPVTMGFDAFRGTPTSAVTATPPANTKATATALYLQETGDTSLISVNDIHQGQIGDCFLLASIGEIALWHPSAIMNMIYANADGTETVTLHLAASGQLPTYGTTQFRSTTVTIDNTFPSYAANNGAMQDVVNGVKEIWVQVLEKAVATLGGGYNYIAYGGSPMIAMEELSGQTATYISPASLTFSMLQGYMAAGDLIVMDTPSTGLLPYNLVNNHAYMFESVTLVNGAPMIQLGNPWGYNQPQLIPLAQLSSGIAEIDIGSFVDSNLITGGPGNDTVTLSALVTNASVDLGTGNDTLTLANGTNSATVANTETIIGGTGSDTITLATPANNASINLGAGNDTLALGNSTNSTSVANVESLTGGTGNDTITLGSALTTAMSVNLGAGSNRLTLNAATNTGTLSNVATLAGGSGNDAITVATALSNGSIDLGAGRDTLALANAANFGTVGNVETIIGGSGSDSLTLAAALTNTMSVDLGAGRDTLTLANATNTATVSNVETVTGGSGNDAITLGAAAANARIDLGAGNNVLKFGAFANTATVNNVGTIIGAAGNDAVTLANALTTGMRVDLGSGSNALSLANGGNSGTVNNVGTLLGGSGADAITLGALAQNTSIDLGADNDSLTFGNFTNAATVANVETITGSTGNDSVMLASALTGGVSVDLGAGSNRLALANGGNSGTVKNVATLIGGTGSDTVTLGGALVNGSVDLGSGSDTLNLANFTNRLSVANTETVRGGSGNDTIVLTGSVAATVIGGGGMNFVSGSSGADRFVFDQNSYGNLMMVRNFSASNGDKIALDTTGSSTLSANTYDLGGTGLVLNTDLAGVANVTARLATTMSNGGKGAFVYEQDTGELFYSSNGSFIGGGTMIGIITTDGSKPWTFDARSFVQV